VYSELLVDGPGKPRKQVFHRPAGGMLIPFIKLFNELGDDSEKLPIKKIIIGPHPDRAKRAAAVRSLLRAQKYEDVEVVESKIPYIGK
jgi:hypothetical protein